MCEKVNDEGPVHVTTYCRFAMCDLLAHIFLHISYDYSHGILSATFSSVASAEDMITPLTGYMTVALSLLTISGTICCKMKIIVWRRWKRYAYRKGRSGVNNGSWYASLFNEARLLSAKQNKASSKTSQITLPGVGYNYTNLNLIQQS